MNYVNGADVYTARSTEIAGSQNAGQVVAVIVTYNPNPGDFSALLGALLPQIYYAVIVDNASVFDLTPLLENGEAHNVVLLKMSENVGLAAAQNVGIAKAMALEADFVLLSDQDSIPSVSMVAQLRHAISAATNDSLTAPVAAAGPATIDRRTGHLSSFVVERFGFPGRWRFREDVQPAPLFVEVGFLIASGTLIPVEVLRRIGGMRSEYFIDHVDTEWCFRAKAAGYRLLGVPAAKLEHQLGDMAKRVWFLRFRQVMYHAPLRDYYMFRNSLLLLRDAEMSFIWRLYFLWRLAQFAGYFLFFSGDRWQRLRTMLLGLVHGFKDIGGRLECCKRRRRTATSLE